MFKYIYILNYFYHIYTQLDMLSHQIILYQNSLFFSLSKYCSVSLCFIFTFNLCSSIFLFTTEHIVNRIYKACNSYS
ncbi:hypothetical protein PPACK8108_LOCUS3914 [Phakopsora pachyrhizi]|uniref:Uncharacterized protein n=1 Tax=Phakopsora pachyrhizi TaxID=170000 RepID=A0AAV0AM56_PHAPC|nr:hypothetical protein PPACK8108_LOCUS3914 [Phakopsora pachyrhizi]